ncbi:MAG: hypothetical protein IT204_12340 [Fimbriimonadaceae bacterium]|nr:hypothetical protein [Fimbriimonadaceae bacterium]
MAQATQQQAVAQAAEFGVDEATATAVVEAFTRLSQRAGRPFDPCTWSRTVWLAEADRCRRARSAEAHFSLLLHLQGLREQFEEKVRRGARAWEQGVVGERLTRR